MKRQKRPNNPKEMSRQHVEDPRHVLDTNEGDTPELRAKLKEFKKPELIEYVISMQETTFHLGPLPPATELEAYDRACPGAAERIIIMAEAEQKFRHIETSKSESRTYGDRKIGYFLGTFLLSLLIGCAMFCVYIGKENYAPPFLGVAILSVIGRYIPSAISIIKGRK